MARELRIGRPDLPHDYDDGGLVDLNNAPVATIAAVCEIDATTAQAIVTAREQRGGAFANIDEVFMTLELAPAGRRIDMSPSTWQVVRDRAVLVP